MLNLDKCLKQKDGISLIVLVITIIVLAILATTVIISISNSNIMTEARTTTFKSDMQNLKSTYNLWLSEYIAESGTYDLTTINYPARDPYLLDTILSGNVPDKYKSGLKVVEGKLVYDTDDEEQKGIIDGINMGSDGTDYKLKAPFVHCSKLNDFECELEETTLYIVPDIEWVEELETMYEKMEIEMESYMSQMVYNIPDIETAEQAEEYIATLNGYSTFDEFLQAEEMTREDLKEGIGVDSNEAYEEYVIMIAKYMASEAGDTKSAAEIESYITYAYGYDTFEEYLQAYGISQADLSEDEEEYVEELIEMAGGCAWLDYFIYKFIGPNATLSDIENLAAYLYGKGSYENMFPLNIMGEYTCNSLDDFKLLIGGEYISDRYTLMYLVFMYITNVGLPSDITYVVTNGVDTITSCVPCNEEYFTTTVFSGMNTITLTAPDGTSISKQVFARYHIEYNLLNCTLSNMEEITSGVSYSTTITVNSGYDPSALFVTVIMGGVDITSSVYSNGKINIPSINGDIVITAKIATYAQIEEDTGIITLTPSNVKDYYGKEVTNYQIDIEELGTFSYLANDMIKWRLFFVDFYGDFGEAGTIYIKADYNRELDYDLKDTLAEKTLDTLIIDEMNPKWAEERGTSTDATWNNNEKLVASLCNTEKWKNLVDESKANFAIGSPSIEMYCESYNQVPHKTGVATIEAIYGDDGYSNSTSTNSLDNTGYNSMYCATDYSWWLSSPHSYGDKYVCSVNGIYSRLEGADATNAKGICPVVSLKSTFVPRVVSSYSITYELTNVTKYFGVREILSGKTFAAKFIANFGYELPNSINVKIGDKNYYGYNYDASTGMFQIPKNDITGDVVINVKGIALDSSEMQISNRCAVVHCKNLNNFNLEYDVADNIITVSPDVEWEDYKRTTIYEALTSTEKVMYVIATYMDLEYVFETAEQAKTYIAMRSGYNTFDEYLQANNTTIEDLMSELRSTQ